MTKLELTATILAGICGHPNRALSGYAAENVALALQYANELIKQLDEEGRKDHKEPCFDRYGIQKESTSASSLPRPYLLPP